jgi:hypothetical protein
MGIEDEKEESYTGEGNWNKEENLGNEENQRKAKRSTVKKDY